MEQIAKILATIVGESNVRLQEPMKNHTTFRIGGAADLFITPASVEQLIATIGILREKEMPFLLLGNGSNLLVGDKGIRGAVIQLFPNLNKIEIQGDTIRAEGGVLLSALGMAAAENSLTGLEFAAGIPGTLGGASVMNAGAYGGEMKDVLVEVEVLTKEMQCLTLPASELELSYRHSIIPEQGYIVLRATMKLAQGEQSQIKGTMADLAERRREKQPLQYPSAGSTFKRPAGYFAGKLVEDAGLKGKRIGGAEVSQKHAGFVVNCGGATAQDVLDLIQFCQDTVQEAFHVQLEPEVKLIGEF